MSESELSTLIYFFEAYLHPDWRCDYDDPWDALSDFASADPHLVDLLVIDVDHVLGQGAAENVSEYVETEIQPDGINPEVLGISWQLWFQELRKRIIQLRKRPDISESGSDT